MCVLTGEGRSVPSGHGLRLYRLDQPSRMAVDQPVTAERLVGCFRGVSRRRDANAVPDPG
jgi:hypothetical protein